tara:strand:+ start:853 stop:1029 length:177 start_codon:yes stop_codon:yes gene_type:complete
MFLDKVFLAFVNTPHPEKTNADMVKVTTMKYFIEYRFKNFIILNKWKHLRLGKSTGKN